MAMLSPIVLTPAFSFRSATHISSSVNGLLQMLSRADRGDGSGLAGGGTADGLSGVDVGAGTGACILTDTGGDT